MNTVDKILMTETEAAAFLKFKPATLQLWRFRGGGPRFVKVSARAVRYRPEDLDAWVEERLRTSTSEETVLQEHAAGQGS